MSNWFERDGTIIFRFSNTKILDEDVMRCGSDLLEACKAARSLGRMLVDFTGVDFMSSAMIGKLVLLNKKTKQDGVRLKLCHVCPNVLEVFKITRLHKVFDFDRDEPVRVVHDARPPSIWVPAKVRTPFDAPFSQYLADRELLFSDTRRSVVIAVDSLPTTFTANDVIKAALGTKREDVFNVLFELWDAGLLEQVLDGAYYRKMLA